MDFEDSRNALFPEPNAYIQRFETKKETKKIVFQEPYETLPNYYINNNFTKHDCDCISKVKPNGNHEYHCGLNNLKNSGLNNNDENCKYGNAKQNGFGFDIKSLLPLLGLFNKGAGVDISQLVGLLNNNDANIQNSNHSNTMGLISSLMSNKDVMSGILNLFKGGGLNLFNKKQHAKKELKTTDYEIKNYTRVE